MYRIDVEDYTLTFNRKPTQEEIKVMKKFHKYDFPFCTKCEDCDQCFFSEIDNICLKRYGKELSDQGYCTMIPLNNDTSMKFVKEVISRFDTINVLKQIDEKINEV